MQFKWVKQSSNIWGKIAFFFVLTGSAHATVTVSALNGGPPNSTGTFDDGSTKARSKYYYYVGTSLGSAFMTDASLDLSSNSVYNFGFASSASITPTTGQSPVVAVRITPVSGDTGFIPIYSVNGEQCNDTICQYRVDGSTRYYYAARYTNVGSVISIGIKPTDVCSTNSGSSGCNGTLVINPTTANVTTMTLTWGVWVLSSTDTYAKVTGNPVESTPITMVYQVTSPTTVSCPDSSVWNDDKNLFPGDGHVKFELSNFGLNTSSGAAPLFNIYVVGQDQDIPAGGGLDPVTDSSFRTANTYVSSSQPVQLGSTRWVGGFTNSSDTESHRYRVSFVAQDEAGIYVGAVPSQSGCKIDLVQSAAVEGYLGDNRCFIATAAFGSSEEPPVLMLRKFRDRILLGVLSDWGGKTWVETYYRFSPRIASWIDSSPILKLISLRLLAPLEIFAWFSLRPWVGLGYLLFPFLGFFLVMNKRRKLGRAFQ